MKVKTGTYPLPGLRSLKTALCITALLLLSSSCVTERRVMRYLALHPLPADTVIISDIEYIDTTFYVPVPADTVRDSIPVLMPCPEIPFTSDTVHAKGKYATAAAWVIREQLQIRLSMNDALIEFTVDSLAALRTKTVTITETVTVREKYIPKIYSYAMTLSIFLLIIFIVWFASKFIK